MDRDWSNIHTDVGCAILSKLPEILDHVWFGAVCKNWSHISLEYNQLIRPCCGTLPLLLVPDCTNTQTRRLYSVSGGKVYPNVLLPNIPNRRCCGSSYGWLAFVEPDLTITLINPFKFRGTTLRLPSLPNCSVVNYEYTVLKLITTPDSTPDNYTVVAIFSGMGDLATIRSGDDDWAHVAVNHLSPRGIAFCDIVFHQGLVYATTAAFMIMTINIDSRPPRLTVLKTRDPFMPNLHDKYFANYIVESTSSELFVVRRRRERVPVTKVFKVLKLELHRDSGDLVKLVDLEYLNGDAIFIGDNYSTAVKASNFDGCEPNSVYFLDDWHIADGRSNNEVEDSGIFKIEDKTVSRHYVRDPNHRYRPPAIWAQPPTTGSTACISGAIKFIDSCQ